LPQLKGRERKKKGKGGKGDERNSSLERGGGGRGKRKREGISLPFAQQKLGENVIRQKRNDLRLKEGEKRKKKERGRAGVLSWN